MGNHFQDQYISSDIVSILIQDLSSFKDDSSVAFSMARSAICLLVKSNTVPFVSVGIQPTLYQPSSSRLISVSIGPKWISITGHSFIHITITEGVVVIVAEGYCFSIVALITKSIIDRWARTNVYRTPILTTKYWVNNSNSVTLHYIVLGRLWRRYSICFPLLQQRH